MPCKQNVKCSLCGKRIKGTKDIGFKERMDKIRSHRKRKHPEAHGKSVKKAVKERKKR